MSRVIKWKGFNAIPQYIKKYNLFVNVTIGGQCEFECEQEELLDEKQIKLLEMRIQELVNVEFVKNAASLQTVDYTEVIQKIANASTIEKINDSMKQFHGCRILSMQIIPRMDEESHKKLLEAQWQEMEQKKALKQEQERPKQLTPEELASLPTSSSPLDSVKEKVGKIFSFFSK